MKNRAYKILSLLLSFAIVFSVCAISANAENPSAQIPTYYVKAVDSITETGGDGSTPETAAASVMDIVKLSAVQALTANDTFIVEIVGSSSEKYARYVMPTEEDFSEGKNQNNGFSLPAVTAYTAKMIIRPYDNTGTAYIMNTKKNTGIELGGPTEFQSTSVYLNTNAAFVANNQNVSFDKNSSISNVKFYTSRSNPATLSYQGNTVVFNNAVKNSIYVPTAGYINKSTYSSAVSVVVDNASAEPKIYLGDYSSNSGSKAPTFNGGLNINIKSANKVTFDVPNPDTETAKEPPVINGVLNVVVNANTITDIADFDYITTGTKYIITNTSNAVISATSAEGTFDISEGYKVTFSNGVDTQVATGSVTLTAGKWDVIATERVPIEVTYYVAPGGTGDGSTAEKPAASVKDAVDAAIAAGVTESYDTINVKIVGSSSGSAATNYAAFVKPVSGAAAMTEHKAKLIVSPYNTEIAYLSNDWNGTNTAFQLGGPTEFKSTNIHVHQYSSMLVNGYNVSFDSNCAINNRPISAGKNSYTNLNFVDKAHTLIFENALNNTISFPNGNYVSNSTDVNFTKDQNIIIDNAASKVTIQLGNTGSGGSAGIAGLLNIDVKSADSITFTKGSHPVNITGKLQVVVNANSVDVSALNDFATASGAKKWVLANATGIKGLVSATETEGEFAVLSGYDVKATPIDGGTAVNANNGLLTLNKGVYNITATKIPETKTYYVNAGGSALGTGDGSTPENAAATVAEVVTKANEAVLIKGDTIDVKLVGTSGTNRAVIHTSGASVPSHTATLVISPNGADTIAYLFSTTENQAIELGGPTEFKSVDVKVNSNSAFITNYNDVKFDDKSVLSSCHSIKFGPNSVTGNRNGSTVIFDSEISKTIYMSSGHYTYGSNHSTPTVFTDDVKLVINNVKSAPSIMLGSPHITPNTDGPKFNKDVIIDVKNATSVKFLEDGTKPIVDGKLVVIANAGKIEGKDALDDVTANKKWIVLNDTGINGLISATDTEGVFQVNADSRYTITAKLSGTDTTVTAVDGKLTLNPGRYDILVSKVPETKTYYVAPNGTGDGLTPQTPAETVNKVIATANEDGLIKGDTISVKIIGSSAENRAVFAKAALVSGQNYGATEKMNAHTAKLIVSPYDTEIAYIHTDSTINTSISLGGDTEFKSVNVAVQQYAGFFLNGYDFVLDSNSELVQSAGITLISSTVKSQDYAGQTVVLDGVMKTTINIPASDYTHDGAYIEDINIIVNNIQSTPKIRLGGSRGDKFTLEKNLNINIKNASSVTFADATVPAKIEGGLQFIVNESTNVNGIDVFENLEVEGGRWFIKNASGIEDIVSFTETAGKFKAIDERKIYATNIPENKVKTFENKDVIIQEGIYLLSDSLEDKGLQMVYFKVGTGNTFASYASVKPGETYRFEYNIFTSDYNYSKHQLVDTSNRNKVFTDQTKVISETDHGNYRSYVIEFSVPKDFVPKWVSNYKSGNSFNIFLGVGNSFYTEGYMWGLTCYNVKDKYKNECITNAKFKQGFDYWIWGWEFWGKIWGPIHGEEKGGSGVTNVNDTLILMDYDLSKIDALIADINRDDGEWWDEEDIVEEISIATVKGKFIDQDGNPISNIKLELVSDNNVYKTVTNAKGEFIFKDIVGGFYELFFIRDGKRVETGYFANLFDGDVSTVKIVTNISGALEDEESEEAETLEPMGKLLGTVYTPQLKTVANLKIYLDTIGETVTDESGCFEFSDVPVGEYELYTILEDGSKHVFRTVQIKENVDLAVKLKYDVEKNADVETQTDSNTWIWIVIACGALLIIAAGVVTFIIIKKKKAQ